MNIKREFRILALISWCLYVDVLKDMKNNTFWIRPPDF